MHECVNVSYQVQVGDYPLVIAKHYFGVQLDRFLRDNINSIIDPGAALPADTEVLVCGNKSGGDKSSKREYSGHKLWPIHHI